MLQKLRKLRTNENVLIAVDVLLHSKSSFMSIFLMAFMMRASLKSAPDAFIEYNLVRFALMAFFSLSLMRKIADHPLAAWRVSMFFSVIQVLALIGIPQGNPLFIPIIAASSALESVLYWRPKLYFDATEVTEDRRLRFKSFGQVLIELAKIVMPLIIGFIIAGSSYTRAGIIILIISVIQLFLTILFRPTVKVRGESHSFESMRKIIRKHPTLRRMLALQFFRGIIITSSAYLVISQIHLYRNYDSDVSLGTFTSAAAILSIIVIALYSSLEHRRHLQKTLVYTLAPAAALLPMAAYFFPQDGLIAIVFYIFSQSIIDSFFNSVLSISRLEEIMSKHLEDEKSRLQIESIAECNLSMGRIISQGILLVLCKCDATSGILILAVIEGLAIYPTISLLWSERMRKS